MVIDKWAEREIFYLRQQVERLKDSNNEIVLNNQNLKVRSSQLFKERTYLYQKNLSVMMDLNRAGKELTKMKNKVIECKSFLNKMSSKNKSLLLSFKSWSDDISWNVDKFRLIYEEVTKNLRQCESTYVELVKNTNMVDEFIDTIPKDIDNIRYSYEPDSIDIDMHSTEERTGDYVLNHDIHQQMVLTPISEEPLIERNKVLNKTNNSSNSHNDSKDGIEDCSLMEIDDLSSKDVKVATFTISVKKELDKLGDNEERCLNNGKMNLDSEINDHQIGAISISTPRGKLTYHQTNFNTQMFAESTSNATADNVCLSHSVKQRNQEVSNNYPQTSKNKHSPTSVYYNKFISFQLNSPKIKFTGNTINSEQIGENLDTLETNFQEDVVKEFHHKSSKESKQFNCIPDEVSDKNQRNFLPPLQRTNSDDGLLYNQNKRKEHNFYGVSNNVKRLKTDSNGEECCSGGTVESRQKPTKKLKVIDKDDCHTIEKMEVGTHIKKNRLGRNNQRSNIIPRSNKEALDINEHFNIRNNCDVSEPDDIKIKLTTRSRKAKKEQEIPIIGHEIVTRSRSKKKNTDKAEEAVTQKRSRSVKKTKSKVKNDHCKKQADLKILNSPSSESTELPLIQNVNTPLSENKMKMMNKPISTPNSNSESPMDFSISPIKYKKLNDNVLQHDNKKNNQNNVDKKNLDNKKFILDTNSKEINHQRKSKKEINQLKNILALIQPYISSNNYKKDNKNGKENVAPTASTSSGVLEDEIRDDKINKLDEQNRISNNQMTSLITNLSLSPSTVSSILKTLTDES